MNPGFDVQYVDVVAPDYLTVEQVTKLHELADSYDGIFVHYHTTTDNTITVQYQFYNQQACKEAMKAFRKYLRRQLPRKTWIVEAYPPESTNHDQRT